MSDWFRIHQLDARTYLVREARYWQRSNLYLLVGSDAALLFDSGCGRRDVTPVVRRLTNRPLLVTCSHTHYDHVGNHARLVRRGAARVVLADLAATRRMLAGPPPVPPGDATGTGPTGRGEVLDPPWRARMAPRPRPFPVHQWWSPGRALELGDRTVELVPLPGHTADSVGVVDRGHGLVLVGDFVYDAPILAALPSSSVSDYRRSGQRLLDLHDGERILCGHYRPTVDGTRVAELTAAAEAALTGRPPRRPLTVWRCGRTSLLAGRTAVRRPPTR